MSGPASTKDQQPRKRLREGETELKPLQEISKVLGIKIRPLEEAPLNNVHVMAHCKVLVNARKIKWFMSPFTLRNNVLYVGKFGISGVNLNVVSFAIQAKQKGCDTVYASGTGAIAFEPYEIMDGNIHHWYSIAPAPMAKAAESAISVLAAHLKASMKTGDLNKLREVYAAIRSHMMTKAYTGEELKSYIGSINDSKTPFSVQIIAKDQVVALLATVHASLMAYFLSGCTLSERLQAVESSPSASIDLLVRVLLSAPPTLIPVRKFISGQGIDDAGKPLTGIKLEDARPEDSVITGVQVTQPYLSSVQASDLVFINPAQGVYQTKGRGSVAKMDPTLASVKDMQALVQLARKLRIDPTPVEPVIDGGSAPTSSDDVTMVETLF